jgi:uncharacterized coiled-coil DUF342 family protein
VPEPDATDKDQQLPLAEGPWHDKIVGDAIGYSKGLVAILDSLSEGFRRRGQELEEQRHRLSILQSERRGILEARAGLEAQIASLAADRDSLLGKLGEREQELEKLRKSVALDRAALETRTNESQGLQVGKADPTRQVEELREVVRSLERQLQRARAASAGTSQAQVLRTPLGEPLHASRPSGAGAKESPPSLQQSEDPQAGSLAAERDWLRSALDERDRNIEKLRQSAAQGQSSLEARSREIQELQARMAESVRQLEELREVVQGLERERESLIQGQSEREAEIQEELLRVREAAARAGQEQVALREDLVDAESVLGSTRKDLASAKEEILQLERTRDEERSRNVQLEERLRSHGGEIARLKATVQAAQSLLGEIVGIIGGAAPVGRGGTASQEGGEGSELVETAEGPDAAHDQAQGVLTVVRPILEAVQEVLAPADSPSKQPEKPAAGQAPVKQRTEQIAEQWRRFLEERAELLRRARRLREENGHLSAQVAAMLGEREIQREGQQSVPARDPRARKTEPASERGEDRRKPQPPAADRAKDSSVPTGASPSPQKGTMRRSPFVGMTVECMLEGSGAETTRIIRGEITRINTMGLMGAFEEQLPEGRRVIVRFARDGEEFSFLGRVVRVQQLRAVPDNPSVFDHLIRFESSLTGSTQELMALLT